MNTNNRTIASKLDYRIRAFVWVTLLETVLVIALSVKSRICNGHYVGDAETLPELSFALSAAVFVDWHVEKNYPVSRGFSTFVMLILAANLIKFLGARSAYPGILSDVRGDWWTYSIVVLTVLTAFFIKTLLMKQNEADE